MTCTVGPVSAIVIDVIHPGVRATGSSVLALFQNLFGLAAGPFIAGMLSDAWGLTPALTSMPAFGLLAALAFMLAARTYEADMQRAAEPPPNRRPIAGARHARWPDTLHSTDHRTKNSMNGLDDAAAAADLVAADARRAPPRRAGDRLAPRRRRHPPLHLPRAGRSARAAWPTRWPRSACSFGDRVATLAWNGYRHMELYYAVSRLGRGAAHAQPAPAPRPDRLDRRPRRGPGAVLRPDLPAAGRGDRRARARRSRPSSR